jgi:hypothetical protein
MQIEGVSFEPGLKPVDTLPRAKEVPAQEVQALRVVEGAEAYQEEELKENAEQEELRLRQGEIEEANYRYEAERIQAESSLMRELEQVRIEASTASYEQVLKRAEFVVVLGSLAIDVTA